MAKKMTDLIGVFCQKRAQKIDSKKRSFFWRFEFFNILLFILKNGSKNASKNDEQIQKSSLERVFLLKFSFKKMTNFHYKKWLKKKLKNDVFEGCFWLKMMLN